MNICNLQQHAEHNFSLGIEFANVISARQRFSEVASLAEEIDGHRDQGGSYEQLGRLAAGVKAFTKLKDSRNVDDRSENKMLIVLCHKKIIPSLYIDICLMTLKLLPRMVFFVGEEDEEPENVRN